MFVYKLIKTIFLIDGKMYLSIEYSIVSVCAFTIYARGSTGRNEPKHQGIHIGH
jgi:hypothetical protein